jgi:hypothetical protein
MLLDLSTGVLSNRQYGNQWALEILSALGDAEDRSLVLVLDDNFVTVSWLDGFLGSILSAGRGIHVAVISAFEDTREHVTLALRRSKKAVLSANALDALASGDVSVVGSVHPASIEVFELLKAQGEMLVAEIAEHLHVTVETAQQRLNVLLDLNLIERTKHGKAYGHQLVRLDTHHTQAA